MERENNSETSVENQETERDDSFALVTAVVTDWMLDFLFVSLCRNFSDGDLDEFNKNLTSYEAVSDNLPHSEKTLICAFLSRVIHGNQLEVNFDEEDNKVMPLMSAAKLWSKLKEHVKDESLAKNMTILLIVQSVGLCLEKGCDASSVLQWFEENLELPSNLRVKLGTIVAQKDAYHPFIQSFNYSRMLETTKTFVDMFLKENPSDYLLKVATKAVQSSENRDTWKDKGAKDNVHTAVESSSANLNKENEDKTLCIRPKRKLHTTFCDIWTPEPCKKPFIYLQRISKKEISNMDQTVKVRDTTNVKKRKPRTKWTWEEDKWLIAGVKRHGLGKWSYILQDFHFGERTGIMLKDRWRTLKKSNVV